MPTRPVSMGVHLQRNHLVLAGKGEIRSEDGECCPIVPGKMLHFNEGLRSVWTIEETVRKFFCLQSERPLQL
ncbi:MAG: DUF861 domain-containing protein [Acidobacteria bacterium]|nr:DUF861 domain-containing protein [Acidobacteriota bacterium]